MAALIAAPGCMGVLIGAAATAGVLASQERGLQGAASDAGIRAEINHLWLQHDHRMHLRLVLQVWEGRVLVSGALPDQKQRETAISLARQAAGVREVIDEVVIESRDLRDLARDMRIDAAIAARMLVTREIDSINFSIEVVNGTVFVLGTARDAAERERVLDLLRDVSHVRRIAMHVLTRDDPRRFRPAATP
jgi:osmotically-inducible protein OsmY